MATAGRIVPLSESARGIRALSEVHLADTCSFIPIHWYDVSIQGFKTYVENYHKGVGNKPLWITEYVCPNCCRSRSHAYHTLLKFYRLARTSTAVLNAQTARVSDQGRGKPPRAQMTDIIQLGHFTWPWLSGSISKTT